MIKKITTILIFAAALITSCTSKKKEPEELINETPDAVEETSSYDLSSYKGRGWYDNIIERLYKEAVDKNKEVATINEFVEVAAEIYVDSLEEYNKYVNINEDYWKTANNYIAKITDTIARESIKLLFDNAELNYCNSKKELISLRDKITLEKERYDNQVLLLKLAVTLPMIQNYQKNELPDSSKLNEVLKGLDNTNSEIIDFVK